MWETTLNESWPPAEWKDGVVKIAHEELPGDQCFTSGDSYGYKGFDVCYNDWEEGFKRPNNSGKPGFIREYYDYENDKVIFCDGQFSQYLLCIKQLRI